MTRFGRTLMILAVAVLLFPVGSQALEQPWYVNYFAGIKLIEEGRWAEAEASLLLAIEQRPVPQEGVPVYGMWTCNYTPYHYLGETLARQNRPEEARRAYRLADLWGVKPMTSSKMPHLEKGLSGLGEQASARGQSH